MKAANGCHAVFILSIEEGGMPWQKPPRYSMYRRVVCWRMPAPLREGGRRNLMLDKVEDVEKLIPVALFAILRRILSREVAKERVWSGKRWCVQ